jgi:toxin YoeB
MIWSLDFTENAKKDIERLKKSEKQAYQKLLRLLDELIAHPTTGTGKPELKKYGLSGFYSRRITQKHRLVYQIHEEKVVVLVLSPIFNLSSKLKQTFVYAMQRFVVSPYAEKASPF